MQLHSFIDHQPKSLARQWIDILDQMENRRDLIEAALEYADGTHTYDDIVGMVMVGRLWWYSLPNSFMIMEINTFPRQKHLHGFLAGGDLHEIRSMQPQLIETARLAGCSAITLSGRRGWVKALQDLGWKESCATISLHVPLAPTAENIDGQEGRVVHADDHGGTAA